MNHSKRTEKQLTALDKVNANTSKHPWRKRNDTLKNYSQKAMVEKRKEKLN